MAQVLPAVQQTQLLAVEQHAAAGAAIFDDGELRAGAVHQLLRALLTHALSGAVFHDAVLRDHQGHPAVDQHFRVHALADIPDLGQGHLKAQGGGGQFHLAAQIHRPGIEDIQAEIAADPQTALPNRQQQAQIANQGLPDADAPGQAQLLLQSLQLAVVDDPGQGRNNMLSPLHQIPEQLRLLGQKMQRHIDGLGHQIQQPSGELLQGRDLHGQTGLMAAAKDLPELPGLAQLGGFPPGPDGHELGQNIPAHGVDGGGGKGVAGLDAAVHTGAAEGGAAGLCQPGRQILRQQGPGAGHLGHIAPGLADVAVGIPDDELAAVGGQNGPEFHGNQAVFHGLIALPGGLCPGGILGLVLPDAEHPRAEVSGIIAVGEALAVEGIQQGLLHIAGHIALVQGLPVDPGDGGHIFGLLHPALQLQGGHAHLLQILQIVHQAVVLQAQGVLVLASAEAVGQAAGLGAAAPVAGAAADGGGEIALAGIAHTQGAVGKNLDFDGGIFTDMADLLPAQLPAEHHPGHAPGGAEQHPGQGMDGHLGGAVDGDLRGDLFAKLHNAQILDDKGIHARRGRLTDQVGGGIHLPVGDQGVEGQMHLDTPDVTVFHRLVEGGNRKILRALPRVKAAAAKIHGVGAVLYRGLQGLHGPGGGK